MPVLCEFPVVKGSPLAGLLFLFAVEVSAAPLGEQYALRAPHLAFREIVQRKSVEIVSMALTGTNTSTVGDTYRVDEERWEFRVGYELPVAEAWSIAVTLPIINRGGGIFDESIEEWHSFFGQPQGGRDQVRDGEHVVRGSQFDLSHGGTTVGSPQIEAVWEDAVGALARIAVALPSPASSGALVQDGIDLGAQLGHRFVGEGWEGALAVGIVGSTDTVEGGLRSYPVIPSIHLSLAIPLTERFVIESGVTLEGRALKNVLGHPDHQGYLDVGVRYRAKDAVSYLLVVRENPLAGKGSGDITAALIVELLSR